MKIIALCKNLFLMLLLINLSIYAQKSPKLWNPVSISKTLGSTKEFRKTTPTQYQLFSLDAKTLETALSNTPVRKLQKTSGVILEFPTRKGILTPFNVLEASTLHPELAKKFPSIKSYVGYGIDDPTAIVRFSVSTTGLHAMISSGNHSTIYIDPYTTDKKNYIAYTKSDLTNDADNFECLVKEQVQTKISNQLNVSKNANDGKLRTFRLALACTGEYAQFHLNNQNISSSASEQEKKAAVLSAMNTTMTRVNGVFERDLSLTMILVPNNDDIIYFNGQSDQYTNNSGSAMLGENQTVCDNVIGSSNYDIGHVFSTGGGGVAYLNSPCTNSKAGGVTGGRNPIGDPFDIDFVAHEMGHQYGGNHTQNNSCQRSNASVEPGSASTIMGYAGICNPNVQQNSDAHFHAISIQEMWANITQGRSRCASLSDTGNSAPTANAGDNQTIPASTPFVLKGNGADADSNDSLTYCWEQMDPEPATMPPSASSTEGPAFRSLPPMSSPDRYMPALATVIQGQTETTWEVVPSVSRTMNFRLTVRDNSTGGGSTASDDIKITVAGNAGPFVVTTPNTTVSWASGSTQTIAWDVAGTTANGIDAANVDILLSTNGGDTYPITIASAVPNDGTHDITVPNEVGTQNRIMVRGSGHIFYDISNANFEITQGNTTDTQSPTAPMNLTASAITQTTVNLSWDAATDNIGVTAYDVYNGATLIESVTATSYQVTGLTPATAYDFSVRAKDAAGNISDASNVVNITTLDQDDTQAPTAPMNLTASAITQTTVNLSWDAATDNIGVTAYDVYNGATLIESVTATSYQVTGLTPATTYDFSVRAKDAAGNISDASNVVTITTDDDDDGNNGCIDGISSFPYTEGFENTLGSWSQNSDDDDFNWTINSDETPSRGTGPSSASEGTYYLYMESSRPNYPTKQAILTSPCYDLSGETFASFSFKYHMYGSSKLGSLALEISEDNGNTWNSIWTLSGNQGNMWRSATVNLTAYIGTTIQLRFNGVTGNTWRGDIAIDKVSLTTTEDQNTCQQIELAINFDYFPQEISWEIINTDTGEIVSNGGNYTSEFTIATTTIQDCLAPGKYTLTIRDSYGDGLCCTWGNGSYTLMTTEGISLASGATFGSLEATTFTIGSNNRASIDDVITTRPLEIVAFPNPVGTDNLLNVIISKESTSALFKIYDTLGRVVKSGTLTQKAINTSELPQGMYILKLNMSDHGKQEAIPFVKQ